MLVVGWQCTGLAVQGYVWQLFFAEDMCDLVRFVCPVLPEGREKRHSLYVISMLTLLSAVMSLNLLRQVPHLWGLVCLIGGMNLSLKIGTVRNKIQMSE